VAVVTLITVGNDVHAVFTSIASHL